jgi:pimeloyl-ACP methyl ester carboxylesterase
MTTSLPLDPGAGLAECLVRLPDGRRIRTVVAGEGDGPLVVFEAGMSAPAGCWVHTQREISRHARTLSYDRAGYGGSDVDPAPRTLERIVDDLTAVLDAVGESDPVVLVGHSWGGPVLRVFADRHPSRVAGLVFVDASLHETMPPKNAALARRSFAVMALLARIGGAALIRKVSLPHGPSPAISPADVDIMWRDYACVRAMKAGGREAEQILPALPTMRRLQDKGTPPVPTVCVQAGRVDRGMKTLRPLFNATAAQLMAAVPQGRVVVVEGAGHLVPQEQPDAVHEAILAVLAAARVAP